MRGTVRLQSQEAQQEDGRGNRLTAGHAHAYPYHGVKVLKLANLWSTRLIVVLVNG